MIYFKTEDEIESIRKSCILASKTLAEITKHIQPGVSTFELNKIAESYLRDVSSSYNEFKEKSSVCLKYRINGVTYNLYEFQEDDLISIECIVNNNGFFGKLSYTFMMRGISLKNKSLCIATFSSLFCTIAVSYEGNRLGDLGYHVQCHSDSTSKLVFMDRLGCGIGRYIYEDPCISSLGKSRRGHKLERGMVISIDPICKFRDPYLSSESSEVICIKDGGATAQYGHTIVVRPYEAEVLSTFQFIEEQILKNKHLWRNSLQ